MEHGNIQQFPEKSVDYWYYVSIHAKERTFTK